MSGEPGTAGGFKAFLFVKMEVVSVLVAVGSWAGEGQGLGAADSSVR